jgi:hypothetical protein
MVELKFIITNGYVSSETIEGMTKGGWNFVCTVPATQIHPYAMPTDKATIFSKYNKIEPITLGELDKIMTEAKEQS